MAIKKRTLRAIDLNGNPLDQFGGNEFEVWEDTDGKVHITLDKTQDLDAEKIAQLTTWISEGLVKVVANPELSGEEDSLISLEVDGTKYKLQEVYTLEITCDTTLSAADSAKVTAALAQNLPVYLISDKNYEYEKEEWRDGTLKGMLTKVDSSFIIFTDEGYEHFPMRYIITTSGCSVSKLKEDTGPSQIQPNLVAQVECKYMSEGDQWYFDFDLGNTSIDELSGMYVFTAGNCFIQLPLFSPILRTMYKIVGTFIYDHSDGSVKTTTVNYWVIDDLGTKHLWIWSGDNTYKFDMPNYTGYLFKALII